MSKITNAAPQIGVPTTRDPNQLVPPLPSDVTNQRMNQTFVDHGLQDTYVSSHGLTLPVQFLAYAIDVRSITGTADLQAVAKYLEGTGYQPVETSDGKAVVSLFAEDLKDTSAGPYKHLIPIVYASKIGDKKVVPFSNGFSLIKPLTDPSVALVLGPTPLAGATPTSPQPIAQLDVGRDLLGIAKYLSPVEIGADASGRASVVERDAQGKPALQLSFADPTLWDQMKSVGKMTSALSVFGAFVLLANGRKEVAHDFVGWTPKSGVPEALSMSYTRTFPTARLWSDDDHLSFSGHSPLSDMLSGLGFEPKLVGRDTHALTALIPEKQTK